MFCFSTITYKETYSASINLKTSDKLLGNFIESAYNIFSNVKSDFNSFSYWYDGLSKGTLTAKYFIEKFVLESSRFSRTARIKEDFIDRIYKFLFGRDPDKEGIKYWTKYINQKIIYYYKNEYPYDYTENEIITLRWNINNSPKVIYDFINKIMESDEFSSRISSMNVKINRNDFISKVNRSDAKSIYNSLNVNFKIKDYSKEILEAKSKAISLQEKLFNDNEPSSSLKNKILNYLGENVQNVALSFYEISTGESFDINGSQLFKAGSTYKVPLNIILYDLVHAGKINLDDLVEYNHAKHYEGGSGFLQNYIVDQVLPAQSFGNLSKQSIINSDNIAANMLITGISKYTSIYGDYGKILGYPLNRDGNDFTTNEMNTFLKRIYYNEDNNPYYKILIEYLKNSSNGVRIGRYIPDKIVASKYGFYQENYHDIAIVYGDKPFILSIFTRNLKNAEKVIADIAKIIYER